MGKIFEYIDYFDFLSLIIIIYNYVFSLKFGYFKEITNFISVLTGLFFAWLLSYYAADIIFKYWNYNYFVIIIITYITIYSIFYFSANVAGVYIAKINKINTNGFRKNFLCIIITSIKTFLLLITFFYLLNLLPLFNRTFDNAISQRMYVSVAKKFNFLDMNRIVIINLQMREQNSFNKYSELKKAMISDTNLQNLLSASPKEWDTILSNKNFIEFIKKVK